MTDGPPASRWGRALAGAFAGASVWVSLGTLAVLDATDLTRVGALPSPAWLAALAAIGAATGAAVPVSPGALAPLTALLCLWLPWLPLRVPPAFLLWDGPLEIAVWGWVAGTMAWRVVPWPALGARGWASPPRAPLAAWAIAAVLFGATWATVRPRVPAGDEPHYLVIAQSLLTDADLRIENNHRQEQYLVYYDSLLRPDFMRRGVDGQIYSIHAPGVSALVLPAFAAAGYAGAVVTVIALTAAGTAAAWLAAYWLTGSAGAAWAAWLAIVSAAPFLLHGFTIYPDPVGAAAAMTGGLALVALETGRAAAFTRRTWAAIGAALALLPWLHTRFALVAAVLGLAVVVRLARQPDARRALTAFAAVPVAAATAWFGYFWRIYGTLSPAAPYGARPEGGLGFIPAGVVGLVADQQFGLVANAPVLLAGFLGLVPLARRRPRLALELALLVVPYLGAVATYPMWWGGYSAPGRFAVVVVPLLALPLAAWWLQGPAARWIIGVLTGVSAATSAALVLHDRGAFIYNGRDGHALLLDWLSPTVDLTLGLPSVHRDGAGVAAGDALVWIAAAVVVAGLATLVSRWRGSAAAAGAVAAPLTAMLALPVVWAGRDRPAVTPPTSQMALLDRWQPAWRPFGLELTPPTRRLDHDGLIGRLALSTSLRGHRAPGVSPLLRIPEVPAGEFDVLVEGRSRLDGVATVRLGRDDLPMETWPLAGRPSGFTGLTLRLPAIAHSIAIVGDDAARASVRRLMLRPRTLPASEPSQPHALRAVRYGGSVVFAADDNAYYEPGAIWVRGERTARMIVQADDPGRAVLRLTGGAVANTVRLAAPGWTSEQRLAAEEVRDIALPAAAQAPAVLAVTSATGFRPSEHAAGNGDVRWLGVYLTWP